MLDVSDIYILKTIAETGSINKAAERLFMSQPTLSKRISRLEKVLNVELFHRGSTGMKTTQVTDYLINNGQQIQSQLDAMRRHVQLLSDLEGGELHIGVSPVIEQIYFPKVLLDFVEESKNIKISFRVEKTKTLIEHVANGELDIAIGPFESEAIPTDLNFTQIQSEPIVFVVRQGHPILANGKPAEMSELLQLPGIGPELNASAKTFFENQGLPSEIQITCDNYQIARSVVMTSDYYTAGPRQIFAKELNSGELVDLALPSGPDWQAFYLTRPESVYVPAVKKFIDVLSQYLD